MPTDTKTITSDAEITKETILSSATILAIDVAFEIPAKIQSHYQNVDQTRPTSEGRKDGGFKIF